MKCKWIGSSLLAVTLALAANPAAAEWPNDKPIKFIIPYSPGGGFDTIVRAFAPAMEKILGAQVVPENIPGAGGTKGAATVARAAPDGYTIGIYNMPGFTVSAMTGKKLGFELDKVTWLANLATESYGIAVKGDSSIKSFKDLCEQGRPAKLSDTGADSTSSIVAKITFKLIDCPLVNVTGYKGSKGAMIAVMRGEVDATLKPVSSLGKYVDSGDLRMIVTYTDKAALDGVEATGESGKDQMAQFNLRRLIAAPAGLPADIRKRLSDALVEAANSPEVKEWAAKAGVSLDPVDAEGASKMVAGIDKLYGDYKDLVAAK
ncbi:MAG: tripartite tricarboxylate transporter substrate binding protein [Alphaproteobacteria bacterium]|nr:tripartite tricarboxylate transporter substrate binding protein [Alphaproteobacteria bacterium]